MSAEGGDSAPRFLVVVPARLGSTRLPRKPLADIDGLPMVVRVAHQAARSSAVRVIVAADAAETVDACRRHAVEALLTRVDHASGSDRLAEVCERIGADDSDIVVNVQGDEPLIAPALIDAVARRLAADPECAVATAAHAVGSVAELIDPNAVKVVVDARGRALYFSRAPIPWWRDGWSAGIGSVPEPAPLRHVGVYAYRAGFLRAFPSLATAPLEAQESLEQLRILWHGFRIAVHLAEEAPAAGVDTAADLERVRAHFAASRIGASDTAF